MLLCVLMHSNVNVKFEAMKKEIINIIEATSMGKLEKESVLNELLNSHSVRLSFTSIDKAVNDLNLNKRVKWFVWNGELVRKGSMCPEPVIVNGTPVVINEA